MNVAVRNLGLSKALQPFGPSDSQNEVHDPLRDHKLNLRGHKRTN